MMREFDIRDRERNMSLKEAQLEWERGRMEEARAKADVSSNAMNMVTNSRLK